MQYNLIGYKLFKEFSNFLSHLPKRYMADYLSFTQNKEQSVRNKWQARQLTLETPFTVTDQDDSLCKF
jgi:biotin-(acetyl-CoA carboxylase) ligase